MTNNCPDGMCGADDCSRCRPRDTGTGWGDTSWIKEALADPQREDFINELEALKAGRP